MKLIHKEQAQEYKNSSTCVAYEYALNDPAINIAVVTISGRYPDIGRVMNEKCKEIAFVMEGTGTVFINENEVSLKKGDVVLIEPKEKIYWEGNLTMLMPCTPAWTSDQHKQID